MRQSEHRERQDARGNGVVKRKQLKSKWLSEEELARSGPAGRGKSVSANSRCIVVPNVPMLSRRPDGFSGMKTSGEGITYRTY